MNFRVVNACLAAALPWACLLPFAAPACGALPIDVEVAMQPGVPITAPQEWAKLLGKIDLSRVRLRPAQPGDQPRVAAAESRVKVLAILSRQNELILPHRRFKSHNLSALRKYFSELPRTVAEGSAERGRFNLTEKQFRVVHNDLSKIIDFSTTGKTATDLLVRLEKKFATPVECDRVAEALLDDSTLAVELRDMSAGTALAIALRRVGFALIPEKPLGEPLRLRVIRYDRAIDSWPIGWKSDASPRQLAPKMFEFLNLEISGYTLAQALDALEPRLGVPVFMDEWILSRDGIHPEQVQVKLKRGRTYLKKAVDRILSQARLAGELRIDELGQPFYWVTRFGKGSLRAEN